MAAYLHRLADVAPFPVVAIANPKTVGLVGVIEGNPGATVIMKDSYTYGDTSRVGEIARMFAGVGSG